MPAATDRWDHLWPYLLQLWPLRPLRARVSHTQEEATQGHVTHPPCGLQMGVIANISHVNYTTMEDISNGEPVLVGMFFLNDHSAVILFNSGATHDFSSKACIQKCKLVIEPISTPYMISTPGG
jgi:hypothetical protein